MKEAWMRGHLERSEEGDKSRAIEGYRVGQRELMRKVAWEPGPAGHMDLGRWRHVEGHSR